MVKTACHACRSLQRGRRGSRARGAIRLSANARLTALRQREIMPAT